jgi:predicted HTH domain antitoxin
MRDGGAIMTVTIPDDIVQQMGLTEREVLIEIACRLFDAGKIPLPTAGKLAGLKRTEMESELIKRKIPIYRPTVEDVRADVETLKRLGF